MGLLGSLFSNSSSSSSSSSTTNNSYDQRVASDNGGIAIGPGSSYSNEFSASVADIFNKLIDFSAGVVTKTSDTTSKAIAANEAATAQVVSTVQDKNDGSESVITKIMPYIVVIAIALLFFNFKKGR